MIFCCHCFGLAQSTISGRVLNKNDKKPVSNASVFLSNATIGTKTDAGGNFTLRDVKSGKYELVVSVVGFETFHQTLIINNHSISLNDLEIVPKILVLKEVRIKSGVDVHWQRNYKWFKDAFLGTSYLANQCKILNPNVLDLDFDEATNTLKASSYDFLEIENRALGYKVKYLIDKFVKEGPKIHYEGSVLFEELKGTPSQKMRWKIKRQEVYEGSEMHFLRAALNNKIDDEGFRVLQYAIYKNPQRPPDSLIDAKIALFKDLKSKGGSRYKDSLSYWTEEAGLPKILQKLMNFPLAKNDIIRSTDQEGIYAFGCENDMLHVTYNKDHHFPKNGRLIGLDDDHNDGTTIISFSEPYIFFDDNGWVTNPGDFSFFGAWGRYRVAGLLPVDYEELKSNNTGIDSSLNLQSQNSSIDSIYQKIKLYDSKKTTSILFVHFDKTVYTPNENAWFAAYLLDRQKHIINPDVLAVALVNDDNKSIILEQKFLINNGLSSGNIFLPDSIQAGNYSFILYTNQVAKGKPDDVFVQHITVKVTSAPTFNISLNLLDSTEVDPASKKFVLTTLSKDGRPIPQAKINYTIGNRKGSAKTNNEGKCYITIPGIEVSANNNVLETQVRYNNSVQKIRLVIPVKNNRISVKFYPEGGNLVHATSGWVGWETKNADGLPLKTVGVLCKDGLVVDTIETDSYGMGKFKLIPLKGSKYWVKLMRSDFKDFVFKLPEIIFRSPVISVTNALANDTLKIKLTSKYPETITVLVHDYRQIFYVFPVQANSAGKIILVDLKNVPKGLATITVLDSLQRPYLERLFFAHYDRRSLIDIQTDKSQYLKREKVKLALKFKTPDTGIVSVACVQSNRLQIKNSNDIESYVYLKHEMGVLPLKGNYMGNNQVDKTYLENVLLIKGWRRYRWQEMTQTNDIDTVSNKKILFFSGKVTHFGRFLRKPVKLVVMTDSITYTITTDEKGNFTLANNMIVTDENKKVHFWLMETNINDYEVKVSDPYTKVTATIAAEVQPNPNVSNIYNTDSVELKGFEHSIALKEVKITSATNNTIYGVGQAYGRNACGDYVCRYHVLNCANHPNANDNRPPVKGEIYYVQNGDKFERSVYQGCTVPNFNTLLTLKGINYSKEFYGSDYSIVNPSQPEYYSTIFWKHRVSLDSSNQVQLEFYTSDITGPFKIIVQGITENDVVYGEKEFSVK